MASPESLDVEDVSPQAWRLLRVAAGYGQRDVETEVDDIQQAHVSMLESGARALSPARRRELLELYVAELTDDQVRVLVNHF
ncbi:MAG: hypothetical protein V5A45_01935 [Haloarculaceae archaeon]